MNTRNGHPWIHGNDPYRRRLVEFNYHPAALARVERLRRLCPAPVDFERLLASRRAEQCLSRWLLAAWNLPEPYDFCLEPRASRIALVSAPVLERLAESLGLLCHADIIRFGICREARADFVKTLGESRRGYALSGAVRYGADLSALSAFAGAAGGESLAMDDVWAAGWRCVLSCANAATAAVLNRLELKLPMAAGMAPARRPGGGGDGPAALWPLIERVLKSEYPEEWRSCCC